MKTRTIVGLVFITIGLALIFLSPLLFDTHEQTPIVVPVEPENPEEEKVIEAPKTSSPLPPDVANSETEPPEEYE